MTCPKCRKGARAIHYCHRADCGLLAAVDLPKPDVSVTSQGDAAGHQIDVVISRKAGDGTPLGRSYKGTGAVPADAIKDVIEKVLADPYSGEFMVPRKR